MTKDTRSRRGLLAPCLAALAALTGLLASIGIMPTACLLIATLTAGAALVAGLQTRRDLLQLSDDHHDVVQTLDSHRRTAEAEQERLHRELQRHDSLEAELVRAKQGAEAAALAKGEFLATMSHEIRTPLNGIIPMLDLIARGPLDEAQQRMLSTATSSSQQLLSIVDDILDYSKLEASRLELECTSMNLRTIAEEIMGLLGNNALKKGLASEVVIDPTVRLAVRGDPVRLRQVLGNLVSNAIKFTERGLIQLRLRRIGETDAQHLLRFEVVDTGIGIEREVLPHLFAPFSQANASTTRLYGGSGLGLAICKRIVDLMGGRIGVDSVPGSGTTFWFEIPMLKAIGDMPWESSKILLKPALLVSSDPLVIPRMNRLAHRWGLNLRVVETAHEALDFLRLSVQPHRASLEVVIADVDSLRQTVQALHRAVTHCGSSEPPRLVWLTGQTPLPPELCENATTVPRLSGDGELRHRIAPLEFSPVTPAESVAVAAATPAALRSKQEQNTQQDTQLFAGTRVLLVEDNPVNRLVAQMLLDNMGVQVVLAENGQQALDHLQVSAIDIVLMDCQMPVLDGYDATRQWREQESERQLPHTPIVAMTANAMGGDRQRCLDAGMDDYLTKPVERRHLRACLLRWKDARAAALSIARQPLDIAPSTPETHSHATTTAAPPVVVEAGVLDELVEVIGIQTAGIIQLYLDDTPGMLERMEQAAVIQDLATLRDIAHSLKSASANIGARGLAEIARRIEADALTGHVDNPGIAVALGVNEFARIRIALRAYLQQLQQRFALDASR